jgi:DNA-binding HxlR family transcriptional regulator
MAANLAKTIAAAGCQDILATLDKEGSRPFSDLAREVDDKSTANRALRRLVDAGLVERHVLQDRLRSVEYELTARGREVAEIARRLREIERALSGKDRSSGRGPSR